MSLALEEETNAAIVSVCACAFSIEALSILLGSMSVPTDMLTAWSKNDTGYDKRLFQTLCRSLDLPQRDVATLMHAFRPRDPQAWNGRALQARF